MLSNLGNILLFSKVLLSLTIIYFSYQCIKSSSVIIFKKIYQISLLQSTLVLDNHYGMSFKDCNPEISETVERLVNVEQ